MWIAFACTGSLSAATFSVSSVPQFENALVAALTNRQDDVLDVDEGTYTLASTLTYIASTGENRSLTIQCTNGNAIIDAGEIQSTMRGMYLMTSGTVAHVTLIGLTFQNGRIYNPDMGAGLFVWLRYGNLTIQNCIFRNNKAEQFLQSVSAAGAFLRQDNTPGALTIRNCVFSNNTAGTTGGGAYVIPSYGGSVALINNLFVTNRASAFGGGAYIYMITGTLTLDNNTFTRNWTDNGSGGGGAYIRLYYDNCALNVRNSILWGNTADNGIGSDLYVEDDNDGNATGATVNVSYCDINDFDIQVGNHLTQGSNTNADPLLAGGFHLQPASPCIDAGTNLVAVTNDFDGVPRPLDGNRDGVAKWDIGAFEYVNPGADSDRDGFGDSDEITADTSPVDGNSLLAITNFTLDGESIRLAWQGGLMVTQYLERSADLSTNPIVWTPFFTNRPPTPASTNIVATGNTNGQAYYRVRVVR